MKFTQLLTVLSFAVIATGCATTHTECCCGKARCADSSPQRQHRTAAQTIGDGLFQLAQTALYAAATDTVRTEAPFPQ